MKTTNRRLLLLAIGFLFWGFYIMQEEMSNYGIYSVISYRVHEVASLIPVVFIVFTIAWFLYLLYKIVKKKNSSADIKFVCIIFILIFLQGSYIHWMQQYISTAVVTEIKHVDKEHGLLTIYNESLETEVLLESPMLVNNIVETGGQEYLITYAWRKNIPNEGKIQMIDKVE